MYSGLQTFGAYHQYFSPATSLFKNVKILKMCFVKISRSGGNIRKNFLVSEGMEQTQKKSELEIVEERLLL